MWGLKKKGGQKCSIEIIDSRMNLGSVFFSALTYMMDLLVPTTKFLKISIIKHI
jgi:hypothetical protein